MSDTTPGDIADNASQPTGDPQKPAQISGPPIHEQSDGQNRKRKCPRWLRKVPVWVEMACAVALVIITWTYTHYAGSQLRTMIGQKQVSIDTVHLDQRPWIADTGFHARIEPNHQLTALMPLINVGKSPALNFRIRMDDQILKLDEPFTLSHIRFRGDFESEPSLYPSVAVTRIVPAKPETGEFQRSPLEWAFDLHAGDSVTPEQKKLLQKGDLRVYFFEEAKYNDVFGREHYTHWCGWLKKDLTSGVACKVWNDTDPEKY